MLRTASVLLKTLYDGCNRGHSRTSTPPGNLRITPTQRKLALKLFSNKTPALNMEQLNVTVTELETMDVTVKKGFLESSEEFVSMIPFKAHARGLVAYEER